MHENSATAQRLHGLKAKLHNARRHAEKVQVKKTIRAHEERRARQGAPAPNDDGPAVDGSTAVPAYLLDREHTARAKLLSNALKQKRKERAGKWDVPLPKVRGLDEAEVFRVVKSGKRKSALLLFSSW